MAWMTRKTKRRLRNLWWSVRRKISNGWYWLKCWVWYKYNVVYVKSLPPTWVDRDDLMLHACFQIFCDFIDKEKPFEHFQWDREEEIAAAKARGDAAQVESLEQDDKESKHVKKEMEELYRWWKDEYPSKRESIKSDLLFTEEQQQLFRLLRIRDHFWT